MACQMPTKDFLHLSPEADIAPFGCTYPPPLSAGTEPTCKSKDIAESGIISWKLYDVYMRLSRMIG